MARKENLGIRKPMSDETKKNISESIKKKASKKREGVVATNGNIPRRRRSLELIKMRDQIFDPSLFVTMSTGKLIDKLFTIEGGLPKATNYILVGDPGVGKSTVALDILADLVNQGFKCIYISAEMTRIDLHKYVERYPKFGDIDVLFLGEYIDDNPKLIMEEILYLGYDIALIDSFAEVQSDVKETNGISTNAAEKWLVDLMLLHNGGNNKTKTNTMFLAIQQVTKSGVFVGSNKLKHNTTGMLEMRFDEDNPANSYIHFTKNRRGPINKKIYFSIKEGDNVLYYDHTASPSLENLLENSLADFIEQAEKIAGSSKKNPFKID
jgi:predicted ATP-dependent serine protease